MWSGGCRSGKTVEQRALLASKQYSPIGHELHIYTLPTATCTLFSQKGRISALLSTPAKIGLAKSWGERQPEGTGNEAGKENAATPVL
jgi:hypothetical protein